MSNIRDAGHFLPLHRVCLIPGEAKIIDVFKTIGEQNVGAFIVQRKGIPREYVKANILGNAIVNLGEKKGKRWFEEGVLSDVVEDPQVQKTIVQIQAQSISSTADPKSIDSTTQSIFQVREDDLSIGWFFSQEELVRSIQTSPPKFICANNHENSDPDHGTCYFCPARIVRTK